MDELWTKLYNEAMSVINPRDVSDKMSAGCVASAVLTPKGNIYKGICIDTNSSLGMCAERNAIGTMLTAGEDEIVRVVSVFQDGRVMPSCGACRELMMQLGGDTKNIKILLDNNGRYSTLAELLPECTY